jgi:putative endonuclease
MPQYFVYMLASRKRGVLYVGMTSNLARRIEEHKSHSVSGFTSKYWVDKLVHFEVADNPTAAFAREKQLKRWHRQWKIDLIENDNPEWRDLAFELG